MKRIRNFWIGLGILWLLASCNTCFFLFVFEMVDEKMIELFTYSVYEKLYSIVMYAIHVMNLLVIFLGLYLTRALHPGGWLARIWIRRRSAKQDPQEEDDDEDEDDEENV